MADTQSQITSSVAPGDSASSSGKKKKLGKAERAARRSQVGSAPGAPASFVKAQMFSSGADIPSPQPGKFPVVFQTGAGEPSRDTKIAVDGRSLNSILVDLPGRFTANPKYAEFKANSGIDDQTFSRHLVSASLLRLAQQIVHSHVNMGLPLGDFSPLASTDVRVPASVSAIISQFGEMAVPAVGTRYLYSGYEDTVKQLVHAANQIRGVGYMAVFTRLWLPQSASDRHSKTVIAERLRDFMLDSEVAIDANALEDGVLSGNVPDVWESLKNFLGDEPDEGQTDHRDRFDFLFKSVNEQANLLDEWTKPERVQALRELGLTWNNPVPNHIDWSLNVKSTFSRLADEWARVSTSYAQFFEMSSSALTRTTAAGSQSQLAQVSSIEGVTVVKTFLALSAPEFSLAACFPPTSVVSGGLSRNVVVTTPLSVTQRATEFCQLDWR